MKKKKCKICGKEKDIRKFKSLNPEIFKVLKVRDAVCSDCRKVKEYLDNFAEDCETALRIFFK